MFNPQKPLEGVVGTLLLISIICFGILLGLSLSILCQAVTGDRLIGLWGPALGAAIGACATLAVAIYNQHRTELRELREPINQLVVDLEGVADALITLEANCESIPLPGDYPSRMMRRGDIQLRLGRLTDAVARINPSPAFPYGLRSDIRRSLKAAANRLEMATAIALDDLVQLEGDAYEAAWQRIRDHIVSAANRVTGLIETLMRLV